MNDILPDVKKWNIRKSMPWIYINIILYFSNRKTEFVQTVNMTRTSKRAIS